MLRTCIILALCSCSAALKIQNSEFSCGIVLGAFNSKSYREVGKKVAAYIRNLNISKGWCPGQPELDKVNVAYFTDEKMIFCPQGVKCMSEADMAPWEGKKIKKKVGPGGKVLQSKNDLQDHLGSWKVRWYHAQMLINSPWDLTLYLDIDALPCSGQGIANFFKLYETEGVTLGSIKHNSQKMSKGAEGSHGLTGNELEEWKAWPEHNAGVIFADLRVTKPMFETWAQGIKKTAGKAPGDQVAYRQATFLHRRLFKEHYYADGEVCRNLPTEDHSCQTETPCWVFHKPGMRALKMAGLI